MMLLPPLLLKKISELYGVVVGGPQRLYACLERARFTMVVGLTLCMCVALSGKSKCFSVIAAQLQNSTCASVNDSCGMATLNWVAFLSETIVLGSNPFVVITLTRVHSGVLGGRVTYQSCMLLVLGALLTSFVGDPESLFVTDTLIQGLACGLLLGLVTFKLGHSFPEQSEHQKFALLLTEAAPWLGVVLCPLYGWLVNVYGWRSSYLLIALIVLLICVLAGVIEPKLERHEEDEMDSDNGINDFQTHAPEVYQDYWDLEEASVGTSSQCRHPSSAQLLFNANVGSIVSQPAVALWLVQRGLAVMVEFNLVINVVHYMTFELEEPLPHAAAILVTLGAGYIMGYVMIYVLGSSVRSHLLMLYLLSALVLVVSFSVWQIYGGTAHSNFKVPDAHFIVLVLGVFSATTSAQLYHAAPDIMQRPRVVALSLTKLAQALALMLGPLTSGVLIQLSLFTSYFAMQAIIHALRILLLGGIIFFTRRQKQQSNDSWGEPQRFDPVQTGPQQKLQKPQSLPSPPPLVQLQEDRKINPT